MGPSVAAMLASLAVAASSRLSFMASDSNSSKSGSSWSPNMVSSRSISFCVLMPVQTAFCRKLLFAGFLVPSCPKCVLVWGMVVRGFAHRDLC